MAEPTRKSAKAAASAFEQASETLRTEFSQIPRFGFPRLEIPVAYRELAEKGIAQARQNYERVKAAAEETNELIESTYTTAMRGASEYGRKIIEALRANANANFDFARDLLGVKSASEAVEVSSAYVRKQFDVFTAQSKEFTSLAQKLSNETAEPIRAGFNRALRSVA